MDQVPDTIEDNLMRAAVRGDDRAMDRLYSRLSPSLFNYLRKLGCGRDDADDVLQAVFMKAWESRNRFTGQGVRLWLFTITRNTWYSLARRNANPVPALPTAGELSTPEQEQTLRDLSSRIDAALKRLPNETREVVVLSRVSNMGFSDIAALLEITEANVRVRLHRGLKTLRAELES